MMDYRDINFGSAAYRPGLTDPLTGPDTLVEANMGFHHQTLLGVVDGQNVGFDFIFSDFASKNDNFRRKLEQDNEKSARSQSSGSETGMDPSLSMSLAKNRLKSTYSYHHHPIQSGP